MTVESTTSRVSYTGSGSTGPFAIPFYFIEDEDIRAIKVSVSDGTETELDLDTDFTLTGAGDEAGGELTLVDALSSDYELVIFRDPAVLQETAYPKNDPFPSATHERVVDRLTMIDQRFSDLLSRAVRLPDGDTSGASMELPVDSARAGTFIGFDANGDITVAALAGDISIGDPLVQKFSGDGSTVTFALSAAPDTPGNVHVYISGVRQYPTTDYSVSGTSITFVTAPASGTENVLVEAGRTLGIGVPSDGTVTGAKIDTTSTFGIGTAANAGNWLRIHHNTLTTPGINNPVWIQRTVNSDEGATNPKALRVNTVINVDTAQTEWAISGEMDNYSDTSSSGNAVISATGNKYAASTVIAMHANAKDMQSYDNYADVTAVVGIEAHARGIGLDHQTANNSLGKRISIDVVAGTSNSTPTWSEWATATTYAVGDHRVPVGTVFTSPYIGFYYVATAITTGISGANEPTWPTTIGNTVVDSGVTWTARRGAENGCGIRIHNDNGGSDTWGYYRVGLSLGDVDGGNTNVMGTAIRIRTSGPYGIRMITNAHTTADISLEANSSYGLSATGTYTNGAVRVGDDQYIVMETTGTSGAKFRFVTATDMLEFSNGGSVRAALELDASTRLLFNGTQVLAGRVTGFVTSSGTANKDASAINVDTITATDANLRLIGAWVKAINDALITHGAIGA